MSLQNLLMESSIALLLLVDCTVKLTKLQVLAEIAIIFVFSVQLNTYIFNNQLCVFDISGIVETTRPDNKNWQYQSTIKQGDILLNRIQKLSRVINI